MSEQILQLSEEQARGRKGAALFYLLFIRRRSISDHDAESVEADRGCLRESPKDSQRRLGGGLG